MATQLTCSCGRRATLKCFHLVLRDKRYTTCDAPLCVRCSYQTASGTTYCRPHYNFSAKQGKVESKSVCRCIYCGRPDGGKLIDACQSPDECEAYRNLLTINTAVCASEKTRISQGQIKYLESLERRHIAANEASQKILKAELVDCTRYAGSLLIQWYLSL